MAQVLWFIVAVEALKIAFKGTSGNLVHVELSRKFSKKRIQNSQEFGRNQFEAVHFIHIFTSFHGAYRKKWQRSYFS